MYVSCPWAVEFSQVQSKAGLIHSSLNTATDFSLHSPTEAKASKEAGACSNGLAANQG